MIGRISASIVSNRKRNWERDGPRNWRDEFMHVYLGGATDARAKMFRAAYESWGGAATGSFYFAFMVTGSLVMAHGIGWW
jgi:hypothetical protein